MHEDYVTHGQAKLRGQEVQRLQVLLAGGRRDESNRGTVAAHLAVELREEEEACDFDMLESSLSRSLRYFSREL
jgi:hypothetical protein